MLGKGARLPGCGQRPQTALGRAPDRSSDCYAWKSSGQSSRPRRRYGLAKVRAAFSKCSSGTLARAATLPGVKGRTAWRSSSRPLACAATKSTLAKQGAGFAGGGQAGRQEIAEAPGAVRPKHAASQGQPQGLRLVPVKRLSKFVQLNDPIVGTFGFVLRKPHTNAIRKHQMR
jgi:hypothetical protein